MTVKAHITRNSLCGGIVAVGSILAVGCGSQSATSAAPPTAQASASSSSAPAASAQASTPAGGPSGTATNKASSQPSATHGSAAPAGKPACVTANLRLSLGAGGGAAGTDFTVIDFTNSGSAPCTLYGFPGVSLTNSSGAQIGAAATRNPSRPSTLVTLAPGAKANANFGVANAGNYPAQDCKPTPAAHLKVFPPNQTQPIVEPFTTTACAVSSAHQLSVTAVAAGQGQTVP
jgi:pyruvate/2-oxoglutarate dehydrogenase complex dihydrolipoamide acyltransferase (E2) component